MTDIPDALPSLSAEADAGAPSRTRRPRVGLIATAVLSVVVAVAVVLLLWSTLSGSDTNAGLAAPAGNFSTRINAAMRPGDDLPPMLQAGMGGQIVPGSVVHIGRAQAISGDYDLFTWREVPNLPVPVPGDMTCFGQFEVPNGGGGASCGSDDGVNEQPGLGWSNGGDNNSVEIDSLPRGASWIVVDTDTGARIVGNVVANVAFVAWPSEAGSPQSVQVLDPEHRVLWAETMDR